jgi:hypothetical protein
MLRHWTYMTSPGRCTTSNRHCRRRRWPWFPPPPGRPAHLSGHNIFAGGVVVNGWVEAAVFGFKCTVDSGAVLEDSVPFDDVSVGCGAAVRGAAPGQTGCASGRGPGRARPGRGPSAGIRGDRWRGQLCPRRRSSRARLIPRGRGGGWSTGRRQGRSRADAGRRDTRLNPAEKDRHQVEVASRPVTIMAASAEDKSARAQLGQVAGGPSKRTRVSTPSTLTRRAASLIAPSRRPSVPGGSPARGRTSMNTSSTPHGQQ